MEDPRFIRPVASGTDDMASQVAHQRLIKGFRHEEEEYNRRHLLYGDDHIERPPEKPLRTE